MLFRSVNLLTRWIIYGEEQPLGEIEHVWYRHEYQPDVGNMSHVHMLLWTKEGLVTGDEENYMARGLRAQQRISADIRTAFQHVHCSDERLRLESLADEFQRHSCTSKCVNEDGTCRYKCPFPLQDYESYSPLQVAVPEDLHSLLLECDLATRDTSGKIHVRRELLGGKWSPIRGSGMGNVSPFVGKIFEATGSQ